MSRPGALAWAALALLPLAALAARAWLTARYEPAQSQLSRTDPRADPASEPRVLVLAGETALADGSVLAVRIAPLHADAARQSFDAAALRERLGLSDGEPFACRIERRAAEGGGASLLTVALGALHVFDARGATLAPAIGAARARALEPLVALLGVPREAPAPGQVVRVVLWGRAPEPPATLELLAGATLALAPVESDGSDTDVPLARLDARAATETR